MNGPQAVYAFEHLLTREAAYSALLASNRQALHGLAAEILAQRIRPGTLDEWELLPQLCVHLSASGRHAEAYRRHCDLLRLQTQAGRFEGWDHCNAGAALAWTASAEAGPSGEPPRLLQCCAAERRYAEGAFSEALDTAEALLNADWPAPDPLTEARLLLLAALCRQRLGQVELAETGYRAALERFEALGDRAAQSEIERALAVMARDRGDGLDSLRHNGRALDLAREAGSLRLEAAALISACNTESIYGTLPGAERCLQRALELARALGDLQSHATCLSLCAEIQLACDRPACAEGLARESLTLADLTGNQRTLSMALSYLGVALAAQGQPAPSRAALSDALRICDRLGYVWGRAFTTYWWTQAELLYGDSVAAAARAAEALVAAQRMGNHFIRLPVLAALAELELRRGNAKAALEQVLPAAASCAALSAYFALPVLTVAARACSRAGQPEAARAWLAQARERSTEFREAYPSLLQYRAYLAAAAELDPGPAPRM